MLTAEEWAKVQELYDELQARLVLHDNHDNNSHQTI